MSDVPQPPPPPPPAASATPAAKPKAGVGQKILVGCLVVFVVIGAGVGGAVWWFAKKIQRNPAGFAAQMIVAGNPELEVVSTDDDAQTVTIRSKKTGETLTMNADELKEGKLRFKNEKGEEITFHGAGANGEGAITVTSKEGTSVMGKGAAASVPAWVPAFPGANPEGAYAQRKGDVEEGAFGYVTAEAGPKVLDFYQAQLEGEGYEVERSATEVEGFAMGSVVGKNASDRREVTVVVVRGDDGGKTFRVQVQYASRP